jgi:activator of 2-hydroxyglutaryl-CoA dehydratase
LRRLSRCSVRGSLERGSFVAMRIGIDVGGTNTDAVLMDGQDADDA